MQPIKTDRFYTLHGADSRPANADRAGSHGHCNQLGAYDKLRAGRCPYCALDCGVQQKVGDEQ